MSEEHAKKQFRTSIGGQALIEGNYDARPAQAVHRRPFRAAS